MAEAQSKSARIYFEDNGAGTPVLFISGMMCDHGSWGDLPSEFSGHRTIVFDNRDIGRSSLATAPYDIRALADDTLAVLDHLNLPAAHIIGHSMGGQIAQELCLAHPDRVRSLVLVNTWAKTDAYVRACFGAWQAMRNRIKDQDEFLHAMIFFGNGRSTLAVKSADDLVNGFKATVAQQTPEAFLRNIAAGMAADTLDRLKQIARPTLVIWGDEDVIFPPVYAQQLIDNIPRARSLCIEGTGHGSPVEKPEIFIEAVRKFLSEADR
ncbi:MAG: alpha/beta fold hydrolase [Alphaproteobacteria bacterium]|nr:alpha/beta fold hydrolase [Alphaproteobacteria bacterium]